MTALAGRVLWVSLTTSAALLPLLMLRERLSRRYTPGSCYVLWLVLALRLLCPVELPLPALAPPVELPQIGEILPMIPLDTLPLAQNAPHSAPVSTLSLGDALALVWLVGAAATLVFQTLVFSTYKGKMWRNSRKNPDDTRLLGGLGGTVPVGRGAVSSPVTLGLVRPVILLPPDLDGRELEMALEHELCHLRRRDIWYKGLFLLCACVHWYNPLVWKLGKAAGETVELCCDRDVVSGRDGAYRRAYGELLLHWGAGSSAPVLTTPLGGADLKGRIMNLYLSKKNGGALVCAVLCGTLLLGSLTGCEARAVEVPKPLQEPAASVSVPEVIPEPDRSVTVPENSVFPALRWPLEEEGEISALHGERVHPVTGQTISHSGIDIAVPEGTPVLTAADGVVEEAGFDKQYGNYVLVAHSDGKSTLYAQLQEVSVQPEAKLAAGDQVGLVGRTGMATGPHLHFAVRWNGQSLDPLNFYPAK